MSAATLTANNPRRSGAAGPASPAACCDRPKPELPAARSPVASDAMLQRRRDRRVIAPQRREMVGEVVARNAPVVAAIEGRRQTQMRRPLSFPESRLLGPVRLAAGPHRHPDLDPDLRRVAPFLLGQ